VITATSQYLDTYAGEYLDEYLDVEMVDIKVNGSPAAGGGLSVRTAVARRGRG
jgi:hypothetical protein